MQHADLHLLVRQLQHRGLDRLGAALHVGLDQRPRLPSARRPGCGPASGPACRARRPSRRRPCRAACGVAELGDLARAAFVLDHHERLAGRRHAGQAEDLHRASTGRLRSSCWPLSSSIARTRPHSAPATTMSPCCSVPFCTSTVATGPRPRSSRLSITVPSAARSGLAFRSRISACSRIASVQLVEAGLLGRRDLHVLRLAAHLLDDDLVAEQFLAHAVRIGVRLVHLVDGDDDRRVGGLGVADRLDGLRHHAVIGGDHQHDDVGDRRRRGRAWR